MITEQQIIEAIAESLTLPVADVDPEAHLQDDMGLNPVEKADLLETLAQKFNIIFEPVDIAHIKTIGDVIETIEDKLLD